MITSEVFYHDRHWQAAIIKRGKLGQTIERHLVGRFGKSKAARERAAMVLKCIQKGNTTNAS